MDDFIESKYYPDSLEFEWKDPHNMSKDNIISLCNHIRHRQNEHGADDIFRFHAYYNGKEMVAAEYGREVNVEIAAERARKQKASRKAAKKKSNKDLPIPQLPIPRPNTDSSSQNEPRGNLLAIDPNSTSLNDNQNGPTTNPQHSRKPVAINGSSQVITRSKSIHKGKRRK